MPTSNRMIGDFSGSRHRPPCTRRSGVLHPPRSARHEAPDGPGVSLHQPGSSCGSGPMRDGRRHPVLNVRFVPWRIRTSTASTRSVPTGGTTTSSSRRWRPHRAIVWTSFAPAMSLPPGDGPQWPRNSAMLPAIRSFLVPEFLAIGDVSDRGLRCPQTTGVRQQSWGEKYVLGGERSSRSSAALSHAVDELSGDLRGTGSHLYVLMARAIPSLLPESQVPPS